MLNSILGTLEPSSIKLTKVCEDKRQHLNSVPRSGITVNDSFRFTSLGVLPTAFTAKPGSLMGLKERAVEAGGPDESWLLRSTG